MKSLMNLKGVKSLNRNEQKVIFGGIINGTFNCFCNGTPLGTGADANECAEKCSQCVSNGGCSGNLNIQ